MPIQRSKSVGSDNSATDQAHTPEPNNQATKRYAKTLRLTSDQLKSLNLKKGANTLTFSVTSSYQGKAICSAKLFLWDHDYQVVISDIDGTITKSDALGHIFTMAGKDWTHTGVAKLYTDITNNGYHILYLTSRAIGQADYTRKYLKNVEQDNYYLPDGPVIMSPDRLMTAFHREVIMRKPEEFKMACLRDIRRLFEDRNPFYAGFGNRITDAMSYRSVNVPSSRIFTIDSGGEVKLELLSSYKSS
ncbi:Lipin/Ned1/Smp2-domain-containing protein [Linnemannia elongata]|nr:Lipin/Ned1/Smp2-domain-containing protein [Linnemannia elongata]KAK5822804.1 Lipin/Ned1/Smp2-domain-containing protein [Linnemannia elongata]